MIFRDFTVTFASLALFSSIYACKDSAFKGGAEDKKNSSPPKSQEPPPDTVPSDKATEKADDLLNQLVGVWHSETSNSHDMLIGTVSDKFQMELRFIGSSFEFWSFSSCASNTVFHRCPSGINSKTQVSILSSETIEKNKFLIQGKVTNDTQTRLYCFTMCDQVQGILSFVWVESAAQCKTAPPNCTFKKQS